MLKLARATFSSLLFFLSIVTLPTPSHALYSTRAAEFAGSYIISTINDPRYLPLHGSSQGVFSFWYNSSYLPQTFSAFIQVVSNNQTIFSLSALRGRGSPLGERNLFLFLSDGAVPPHYKHWAAFVSVQPLDFDGRWHHVSVTWDTAIYNDKTKMFAAVASYGTLRQQGPPTVLLWSQNIPGTDGSGEGFETPYLNSLFTIGAGLNLQNGNAQGFYRGLMSQVFGNFGVSRYTDIISSFGSPSTIRVHSGVSESNQFGLYVPTELGSGGRPGCRGPFGPPIPDSEDIDAAICMTGGPASFYDNQGGDTRFLQGSHSIVPLQISPTDPFGGIADPYHHFQFGETSR